MSVKKNLKFMKMTDDAWNAQDWDTLKDCYSENVEVFWPNSLEPKKGRNEYINASKEYFKTFPDAHIEDDPYKICFGMDDWTCTVAIMNGTNKGPVPGPNKTTFPATNKPYRTMFCTIARWKESQIVEMYLFYDMGQMMTQLGLTPQMAQSTQKQAQNVQMAMP